MRLELYDPQTPKARQETAKERPCEIHHAVARPLAFVAERGDLHRCLVRRSAGWLLVFDLMQPSVERRSGDTKIPGGLAPENWSKSYERFPEHMIGVLCI